MIKKVKSCFSKRFFRTKWGKWKLMHAKACNRHRLVPKSKRQKALAGRTHAVHSTDIKAVGTYI